MCIRDSLGGWRSFVIASFWPGANSGWWPMLWFIGKVWAVMFFMIWTRGTLVRIRYDHFMKLGWKFLIPVSLGWFVLVAALQGYRAFFTGSPAGLLIALAAVFLVAMLVLLILPESEDDGPARGAGGVTAPGEELDAFAGGYPVPPLPGQQLPVSPRVRRAQRAQAPVRTDAASSVSSVSSVMLAVGGADDAGSADVGGLAALGLQSTPDSGDTVQEGTDD